MMIARVIKDNTMFVFITYCIYDAVLVDLVVDVIVPSWTNSRVTNAEFWMVVSTDVSILHSELPKLQHLLQQTFYIRSLVHNEVDQILLHCEHPYVKLEPLKVEPFWFSMLPEEDLRDLS